MSASLKIDLPIARPPWTSLGKKLESMCRKALYDFELLHEVKRLGIALSGGKDSLTLLFLLKSILGRGFPEIPLYAFHVTGEFSCGANIHESFLKGICDDLEVPFIQLESKQKRETLECYSCSRERRKLIFDAAKSLDIHTIAFGHHRDDSIQTLVMNLLHKAEFSAILPKVPMFDYGVTLIRPLILISEHELISFAQKYGFLRVTCACPVGQNSMRKKVDAFLNQIAELFPNARENLAQASLMYGSKKAIEGHHDK